MCSTPTRPGCRCWLKARRRIATRRDRKADTYLAFLHLGMILILNQESKSVETPQGYTGENGCRGVQACLLS